MNLGVGETGAVIDGGVDVAVADPGVLFAYEPVSSNSPAAPVGVGNPSDLLDINMDQLAWPVPLVAADRFTGGGGPVTPV